MGRLKTDQHDHMAFGIELDHHVRALVDAPDVIVLVDANHVREGEPIEILADFANEFPVPVEFQKLRVAAAMVHKNVPLGIQRNSGGLTQIKIRRKLQRIHSIVRYLRRSRLSKHRRTRQHHQYNSISLHHPS